MTKVSDLLKKVDENFTVYSYANGYMFEVGGRNEEDDWSTAKILCNSLDEVFALATEYSKLPRS